jgi:Na+/H+ antiporter NhaD/arsenite permease-like protein
VLIILESFHKTNKMVIALCGAAVVLISQVVTQRDAFNTEALGIDWNVIFLLMSMMIIVNIMKSSGLLEYIAIKSIKLARGEPFLIMVIFAVLTALVSAFIDNVTTVLLIAPVLIFITKKTGANPIPYLIATVLASNIGGTATLIGDPPNIMIGSRASLTFMDFIVHLAPAVVIMLGFMIVILKVLFAKGISVSDRKKKELMKLDEAEALKDRALAIKSSIVIGIMIAAFVFHDRLNLQPASIGIFSAGLLLVLSGFADKPNTILSDIEWTSIFFFIGLFIIIGGIVKVGFVDMLAKKVVEITGASETNLFVPSTIILWFSSVASAIIDNIPYVATMNPLILDMAKQIWPNAANPEIVHQAQLLPVWWALALGACLGGNGTIIGASANVVVSGLAEKAGHKISFVKFLVYAFPVWLMTIIVSQVYIWVRYFAFRG